MAENKATVAGIEIVMSYRTQGSPENNIKKIKQGLEQVSKSSQSATKHTNKFISSIARIAGYRLLRTVIKEITQGIRDGVNNLVLWEQQMKKSFGINETLSNIGSNLIEMKNAAGSLAMNLLQVLSPAILAITEGLTNVMNFVNEVVSALRGKSTYLKAVKDDTYDYAKALKEANRQLMGFDELNILKNQESPYKFEEVEVGDKAKWVAENLAALALVGTLGALANATGLINKLFGTKNDLLDTQTAKTQGDVASAFALATALSAVGVAVGTAAVKVRDWLKEKLPVPELQLNPAPAFATMAAFATSIATTLGQVATNIREWGTQTATNVSSWAVETVGTISSFVSQTSSQLVTWGANTLATITNWASSVASRVGATASSWANAIYSALGNMYGNISSFVSSSAQTLGSWASGVASKFAEVGTSIAANISAGVNSAMSSLGSLASAVGTKTSNWVSDHSSTIKTVGIAAAITAAIAGIALAVPTGGASLGLLAFADGGYPQQGSMFIAGETGDPEFVGNVGGRTAVYNSDQLAGSLASANEMVVEAIFQAVNSINSAIANQPVPSIRIGDREIYQASERGRRTIGGSLIQGV